MSTETPIELDGQYRALREEAGIVDRSGRGKLVVSGAEAAEYLQGQLTNDVEGLAPGQGCYAALLDRKGHMQGDMRVLRLAGERIWIDVEAAGEQAVSRHLGMYRVGREVEIEDVGSDFAILSVIGPAAARLVGEPSLGEEHAHDEAEIVPGMTCRRVRTDLGFDLVCATTDMDPIRERLASEGASEVSSQAAEILRVEHGRPRFGAEMTTKTIPQEAGITERAVSFTKGCYIGQETVARLQYKGRPNRHLRGLRLEAPAETGAPICLGEREVGQLGTAVVSPARGSIGLAILRREATPGERVVVGRAGVEAEVVDVPFE